jgi:PAS domain S-box-containing protein
MSDDPQIEKLRAEVRELHERLEEATAILDAMRNGSVDALFVGDSGVERVFTLEGADHTYRVLIEAMQQGAATLSADGTIMFCNRSLALMLKTAQERVSGSSLCRFVPPSDQAQLESMLRQAQASHSLGEIRFLAGDAALLPVHLALSALPLSGTTALGLIVTDLTDQKHEEELVVAHRRKDDFLAILAHELRNPLAPIRTATHLLKMPGAAGRVADQARDMIERQVGNLTRLVDELLDVSRISQGKIQLVKEPIEIATIVMHAVEAAHPLVELRKHVLTVRLPPEPLWLEADPIRLEQVVVNLLNNAAKYTEPGGRIDVEASREGTQIILRVKDTGVGIAPDMLPHVFEMFTQADHSLDRTQGGLGIGLTLVRSLVGLHGGEITGHSDGLGKGSEFIVCLPSLPQQPTPRPEAAEERAVGNGRPLRVVVIDDNQDAGDSLGMLLRLNYHQVEVFQSGRLALQTIPAFRPDVVLLDIGLPDMDGYQVARRLRQQPGGADVLLVAVTGYGQEEDRRRAAAVGFDHHLVKPVEPKVLEGLLADLKKAKG